MRLCYLSVVIVVILICALPARAGEGKIEDWLEKRAQVLQKLPGLQAEVELTESEDGKSRKFIGELSVSKPNFSRLILRLEDDPKNQKKWQHYLCDGKEIWTFDYSAKTALALPLPKDMDQSLLTFLLEAKAADLMKRFELKIDAKKSNQHYLVLAIEPKRKEDAQEFTRAELVLWASEDPRHAGKYMLPAQLWLKKPNQDQSTWRFPALKPGEVPANTFKPPELPKDWRLERPKAGK